MSERSAYERKLEAKLDEWRADIDKLKAKSAGASADAQIEMKEQVRELEKHWATAQDKLHELRASSDSAWKDLKEGASNAYEQMSESLRAAVNRF